ncbi:hypothetical protein [Kalamiella sp. sgz302252]|uniref:hypothetical protein n=1 Tax=Pantoea sp. sgz302252 TaxID=3341827 RepID=UPI0036D3FB44
MQLFIDSPWSPFICFITFQIIFFTIKTLYGSYLTSKINFIFSRKAASQKEAYDSRVKAELLAELLGEWQSFPDETAKIRSLSYKAFLWLPSSVAEELSKLLSGKPDRKSVREVLVLGRQHILNNTDPLPPHLIIDFELGEEEKARQADYALKKVKQTLETQG